MHPTRGTSPTANRGPLSLLRQELLSPTVFWAQELVHQPGRRVCAGMIVGQSSKAVDIDVNVCKTKHLTNTRSSSADEALRLVPPKIMSLEQAIEYVDTDELLEVTPHHLRLRKKILDARLRKRASQKN